MVRATNTGIATTIASRLLRLAAQPRMTISVILGLYAAGWPLHAMPNCVGPDARTALGPERTSGFRDSGGSGQLPNAQELHAGAVT